MKPRRFDQLWNRWLLIDSDLTFDEWLETIRKRRKALTTPGMMIPYQAMQHQMQYNSVMNVFGGALGAVPGIGPAFALGQIGMSKLGAIRR